MSRDESSPKAHRRRAIAGLFCCCSIPSKTPEPDSRVVRITAGIIAIIAMLLSGVGFSALQRATVNPYESLFITASSSRHLAPAAWDGPSAFAPSPQLMLPSAGFVSAEGTSQGPPIESAVSGQAWVSPGGGTAPHAGRFSNAAMAPSPAQSMDNTANKGDLAAVPTASGPSQDTADPGSQGTASVESAVPNSLSSPAPSPARLGATLDQGVIGMAEPPSATMSGPASSRPSRTGQTSLLGLALAPLPSATPAAAPAYNMTTMTDGAVPPAVNNGSVGDLNTTGSSSAADNQTLASGAVLTGAAGNSTASMSAADTGSTGAASMGAAADTGSNSTAGSNSAAGSNITVSARAADVGSNSTAGFSRIAVVGAPADTASNSTNTTRQADAGSNSTANTGAPAAGSNATSGSLAPIPAAATNSTHAAIRDTSSPIAAAAARNTTGDRTAASPTASSVSPSASSLASPSSSPSPAATQQDPDVTTTSPATPNAAYRSPPPATPAASGNLSPHAAAASSRFATNLASPSVATPSNMAASSSPNATVNPTGLMLPSMVSPLTGIDNSSASLTPTGLTPPRESLLTGSSNSSVGLTDAGMVSREGGNSTDSSSRTPVTMTGPALSGQQSAPTVTATSPAANGPFAGPEGPGQATLRGPASSAYGSSNGFSGKPGASSDADMDSSRVGGGGGRGGGADRVRGSSLAPGGVLAVAATPQQAMALLGQRQSGTWPFGAEGISPGQPRTALSPGYMAGLPADAPGSSDDTVDTPKPSSGSALPRAVSPSSGIGSPSSGVGSPSSGLANSGRGPGSSRSGGPAMPPVTDAGATLQDTAGPDPQLWGSRGPDGSRAAAPTGRTSMAPDSNTASTAPSNSLAVAEGSQAPSHALLGSALAPAWAASTPETAFTEGSGPSADASDADDNQAALSPAAFLTHGPGSAGFPAASAGAIGRTDGTSRPASVEGAFADSSPVTGGNMATSGASGPVLAPKQALAPEQALAPRSQLSSSGVLPTGSGNNATASIEGLPGDGSGSTTSAPAVAPSAAVAPKLPTASELAGIGTDLGSKWWLWLLVAMATAATWLCCCCCMAAVLLLHRRSKRRIMAQPVDCEDATAIAAVATAVASPTLLEQPVAAQEASLDKAELTSGPHLSEAVKEATAADGEMVSVPVSQQRVTSLTGPGINAAFLPGQYGSAEARPATDLPPAEGALQETPTTAAVVAVATANATVAASEQSADDRRFSVASATTAATVVAVTAVAGGDKHQDAATARESSSEVTVPGTSQAELLSIMAASSLASAAATHEANERLGSVIAGGSLQAEPADEAGSRGDVESNQLSGFTSQPAAALQTGPEQQAGAAAGDEPWSILSRGQQHGATEAESCVRTTSSNPVVMPSVKQSVSRLEELHAAMRSKA